MKTALNSSRDAETAFPLFVVSGAMMPPSGWTYVLRWWLRDDEDLYGTAAEVIIIDSPTPMTTPMLAERVAEINPRLEDFELLVRPAFSSIRLDTWEPGTLARGLNGSESLATWKKEWWK